MKYLVLLAGEGELTPWPEMTEAEQAALMEKFAEFDQACGAREGVEILAGEALQGPSSATTVRTRQGEQQVVEGPFAEAYEGLGGFYLVEVPNLDVLLNLVRLLPAYDMELRPIDALDDLSSE